MRITPGWWMDHWPDCQSGSNRLDEAESHILSMWRRLLQANYPKIAPAARLVAVTSCISKPDRARKLTCLLHQIGGR